MTSLIVAAIPCDNDPVWKVSSEKVPHLTLLYLGEYEDATERQRMIDFIEHACNSSLNEFYLATDYRGTLGDDKADVLFFSKSSAKMVGEFRSNLLANQDLAKAYLSVKQYPTWTPHLTLGYPNKPAKPDPRENPEFYHWVKFDRVAFWDDDYNGPTVQLKRDEWEEVTMSDDLVLFNGHTAVDKILGTAVIEHFGTKGMKWGVRKSEDSSVSKKAVKADIKWEKSFRKDTRGLQIELHNAAARHMNNGEVDRINNSPKFKDKDFTKDSPLRREYYKAHENAFNKALLETAKDLGTNPSGTKRIVVRPNPNGLPDVFLEDTPEVKHAEEVGVVATLRLDSNGYIVEVIPQDDSMDHGDDLAHYGTKGMKWGVRKSEPAAGSKPASAPKPRLSEDARNAVAVTRKIEKHGGTHALSNKEMETLLNRMNLEQRYSKMTTPDKVDAIKAGQDKANQILNTIATAKKLNTVVLSPTAKALAKWLATKGAKKAATTAVLALL